MATAPTTRRMTLRPSSAGIPLTPEEFDAARFSGWCRYELINGVLVVSPSPREQERDPNEEFGYLLRKYQDEHPEGSRLDVTLHEHTIHSTTNRRRADRAIWVGLGRMPTDADPPAILVEFVSKGKASHQRDYEVKRVEYGGIGTREYLIVDRFQRTMTVVDYSAPGAPARVLKEGDVYRTAILPGFELPISRLFALADRWEGNP